MIKRIAFLVFVLLVAGSALSAADWGGLTIDGAWTTVQITEHYLGPYTGVIAQYTSSTVHNSTTKLLGGGNVYYCLPKITWTVGGVGYEAYGVCIDTNEYTGSPMQLQRGWGAGGLLTNNVAQNEGRLNGTMLSQDTWIRATYLFSKHQEDLAVWWASPGLQNVNKTNAAAFQIAMWEVMSGDGLGGANWGNGYFTAGSVSGDLKTTADAFVAEAFDAGFAQWNLSLANQCYYLHDHQDFLVWAPKVPTPQTEVPEIPAVVLGPLGLAMLGAIRRRFAK